MTHSHWTVGYRFGEADHPGPETAGRMLRICLPEAAIALQIFHGANNVEEGSDYLYTDVGDTGASRRMTSRVDECDNLRESQATWGGAAAAFKGVDFEGDYRYFVMRDDGKIAFDYVPSLVVKEFDTLELTSISQMNTLGVGFDSPPLDIDNPVQSSRETR